MPAPIPELGWAQNQEYIGVKGGVEWLPSKNHAGVSGVTSNSSFNCTIFGTASHVFIFLSFLLKNFNVSSPSSESKTLPSLLQNFSPPFQF
jgi:hypothetical protein